MLHAFLDTGFLMKIPQRSSGAMKLPTGNLPWTIALVCISFFLNCDFVHVLYKGRIVKSGGKELALELEEKGYDWITKEADKQWA